MAAVSAARAVWEGGGGESGGKSGALPSDRRSTQEQATCAVPVCRAALRARAGGGRGAVGLFNGASFWGGTTGNSAVGDFQSLGLPPPQYTYAMQQAGSQTAAASRTHASSTHAFRRCVRRCIGGDGANGMSAARSCCSFGPFDGASINAINALRLT